MASEGSAAPGFLGAQRERGLQKNLTNNGLKQSSAVVSVSSVSQGSSSPSPAASATAEPASPTTPREPEKTSTPEPRFYRDRAQAVTNERRQDRPVLEAMVNSLSDSVGEDDSSVASSNGKKPGSNRASIQATPFESVSGWIQSLNLPGPLVSKYTTLFNEEEIFTMEQVLALTPEYLHWMGVKVGTIITIINSINSVKAEIAVRRNLPPPAPPLPIGGFFTEHLTPSPPHLQKRPSDKQIEAVTSKPKKFDAPPVVTPSNNSTPSPTPTPAPAPATVVSAPSTASSASTQARQISKRPDQLGGHGGITHERDGWIRKRTVASECHFYLQLQEATHLPAEIRTFFPTLDSVQEDHRNKKKYVVMEDLTYGYRRPCVMDVKMGKKTCGDDANSLKKHYMISKDKSTTSYKLGLRIVASKVWSIKLGNYVVFSRGVCNGIATEEQLEKYLLSFFYSGLSLPVYQSAVTSIASTISSALSPLPASAPTSPLTTRAENIVSDDDADYTDFYVNDETEPTTTSSLELPLNPKDVRLDVLSYFIDRLEILNKWMANQNHWRMYSSSLLFVYEGDASVQHPHVKADLRMIDFAHVFDIKEKEGRDSGYAHGLKKMLEILKNFQQKLMAALGTPTSSTTTAPSFSSSSPALPSSLSAGADSEDQ